SAINAEVVNGGDSDGCSHCVLINGYQEGQAWLRSGAISKERHSELLASWKYNWDQTAGSSMNLDPNDYGDGGCEQNLLGNATRLFKSVLHQTAIRKSFGLLKMRNKETETEQYGGFSNDQDD
ncbi:hypothetical protein LOAG_10515, partial [Loa loa]